MAYPHGRYEVMLAKNASLTSTGDVTSGVWAPGMTKHRICGVALVVTNDIGATGVVKLDKRPTAGSDTSRGDGDVAVINLATSHVAGKVVFDDALDILINPGEEVVAEVTDAAASGDTVHIILSVEPVWERPANMTAMVQTA